MNLNPYLVKEFKENRLAIFINRSQKKEDCELLDHLRDILHKNSIPQSFVCNHNYYYSLNNGINCSSDCDPNLKIVNPEEMYLKDIQIINII